MLANEEILKACNQRRRPHVTYSVALQADCMVDHPVALTLISRTYSDTHPIRSLRYRREDLRLLREALKLASRPASSDLSWHMAQSVALLLGEPRWAASPGFWLSHISL